MRATLSVAVDGCRVRHLEVSPPLCARIRRHTAGSGALTELWLVSSGASLLEGDELTVRLELCGGARVALRSVAASVVHPCPDGGWARWSVQAEVKDRSALQWWPEPTVVCAGARYRARAEVELGPDATLAWADELVLGRSGETPGQLRLDTALRIDRDGAPVLRDGLRDAPGWTGAAVTGGARYLGTRHLVEGRPGTPQPTGQPPADHDGWMAQAAARCWSKRVVSADPLSGRCQLGAPTRVDVAPGP